MAVTSPDIALAVLIPLPFCVVSAVLRFWIRLHRKAWGADDWAMMVNIPCWTVSVVSLIGMAWSGVGASQQTLTDAQVVNSLKWFYVFQECWCFTLIAIKWSIGFALLRIAYKNRVIEVVIYSCLTATLFVMGGTGMYLFFQCFPVEKNWNTDIEGTCQPRNIQTVLSFLVAAVSITTDWTFALLPIFLLWNVQMDPRVKLSVVGLLGLGIFASIAPIVRLKFLIGLNDSSKLLENLGLILAWAGAEVQIGMLVANLPACRPLLEKLLSRLSSLTGSRAKTGQYPTGYPSGTTQAPNQYLELEEGSTKKGTFGAKQLRSGVETRIYGTEAGLHSDESLADDESQKHIVPNAVTDVAHANSMGGLGAIHVQTEFTVHNER